MKTPTDTTKLKETVVAAATDYVDYIRNVDRGSVEQFSQRLQLEGKLVKAVVKLKEAEKKK